MLLVRHMFGVINTKAFLLILTFRLNFSTISTYVLLPLYTLLGRVSLLWTHRVWSTLAALPDDRDADCR